MHPTIEYILFDLDGTLYSSHWGLEQEVSGRVNDYLASYLNLPNEEARALRKERIMAGGYGTTLEWLRAEMNFKDTEIDNYFACIHPEDEAEVLPPDPALRSFLLSFSFRHIPIGVLTNSPTEHAQRVLQKLGVADLFHSVYDIRKNGFTGKPVAGMYRRILKELGVSAPSCMLVDDMLFYIEGYLAVGGTGVYFDENNSHPEFPGLKIQKLAELTILRRPDGSLLLPEI